MTCGGIIPSISMLSEGRKTLGIRRAHPEALGASGARDRGDGDGPNGNSPNGGSLAH